MSSKAGARFVTVCFYTINETRNSAITNRSRSASYISPSGRIRQ